MLEYSEVLDSTSSTKGAKAEKDSSSRIPQLPLFSVFGSIYERFIHFASPLGRVSKV